MALLRKDSIALACWLALLPIGVFPQRSVAQAPSVPQALVQQLESPDPLQRAAAFTWESAGRIPGRFAAPGMAAFLVRTLDVENRLIYGTLEESKGSVGVSEKYGEGFGEYSALLFEACIKYCDQQDPHAVQILVEGAFPPEGLGSGHWLARDGTGERDPCRGCWRMRAGRRTAERLTG